MTNAYPWLAALCALSALSSLSVASEPPPGRGGRSICGPTDDRELSAARPFARVVKAAGGFGCTGTLVSPSCMVSAGHCGAYLHTAQFNVPLSTKDGTPVPPAPEDRYPVTKVIGLANNGNGDDWAVFRLGPNPLTGLLPGAAQGFLPVSFDPPRARSLLRVTGYGKDPRRPVRNGAQQTALGQLTGASTSGALYHTVDTDHGNSGATIVDEASGRVIGVHTTGECGFGGGNVGTAIAFRAAFRAAVEACLR